MAVFDTTNNSSWIIAEASTTLKLFGSNAYSLSCFTPDDSHIITTLYDEESMKLFKIPLEGDSHEQLTYHKGNHWYPNVSPDGQWIIYSNFSDDYTDYELLVYNITSGESVAVFPDLTTKHYSGSFSPEGDRICYIQNNNGIFELFVAAFTK